MNSNENNTASKKGLIVGVIALAVVIGLAVFFYNKGSNISTEVNKNVIDEIAKAKEEADKYENNENHGSSAESTDTTVDKEDAGAADDENAPIPAPDFTVYTEDKTPVRFTDMLGKPVIINFWATWCGPCKKEMPHFEKAYKEYGDKIPAEKKSAIEASLAKLKEAHKNADIAAIDTAIAELNAAWQAASQDICAQQQAQQQAQGQPNSGQQAGGEQKQQAEDVEFEEVK